MPQHRYIHTWLTCTSSSNHSKILEEWICKLGARLSPLLGPAAISSKSYASAISKGAIVLPPNDRNCTIYSKIAELLEQEKRKKNIIIYNMTSSRKSDVSRIKMPLKDITGNSPPAFYCRRVGKTLAGKTRPVLFKYLSESDSQCVLHLAHYLKSI